MAIPEANDILSAFANYSPSEKAIRAAVTEARDLARWGLDEPAAVFFAFARRPRAIPTLNASLSTFLAIEQARSLGVSLIATREELQVLRTRVLSREASFEDVRAWFAERMPAD